ncbi:MAG: hypothetical protein WD397_11810 [Wenzhouxiangellaceae bacterium]
MTYLRNGNVFGVGFVTVRSVRNGELQADPREAVVLNLSRGERALSRTSIKFTVLSHPSLLEDLQRYHGPLAHQIEQSLELLYARGMPESAYSMNILIRLMPLNSGFDYRKTRYYIDRPTLEFVGSVDVRTADRFEYSLISMLGTIHHELIHFSSGLGWIEIPGDKPDEHTINEEAFATIVGRCDALALFNKFHGDRPQLKYTSQHPEERFHPATLRASSDHSDLSLLGNIIGIETFVEGAPLDRHLEPAEIDRMLERCQALSRRPTDFQEMYFKHN